MSRIAYVNGHYLPLRDAGVPVEDRGLQFADAVYEVCEVLNGRLIDERRHMARLARSLAELSIRPPMHPSAMGVVLREVVRRNRVRNGIVYLQVTRGAAPRNHQFPPAGTQPTVIATARSIDRSAVEAKAQAGVAIVTVPENRWDRVDIKTVSLLPNVLAKQKAKEAGAFEAWFVDRDGFVTEGASTNAWIVTAERRLVTRPAEHGILRGITRTVLIEVAKRHGVTIDERPFTVKEALAATEAFITGASTVVMPVVAVNGTRIGDGRPGKLSLELRAAFHECSETAPVRSTGAIYSPT